MKLISGINDKSYVPFNYNGYDLLQRTYLFIHKAITNPTITRLKFELRASEQSPLLNPAFVIKNFGTADIELRINNQNID